MGAVKCQTKFLLSLSSVPQTFLPLLSCCWSTLRYFDRRMTASLVLKSFLHHYFQFEVLWTTYHLSRKPAFSVHCNWCESTLDMDFQSKTLMPLNNFSFLRSPFTVVCRKHFSHLQELEESCESTSSHSEPLCYSGWLWQSRLDDWKCEVVVYLMDAYISMEKSIQQIFKLQIPLTICQLKIILTERAFLEYLNN